MIDNRGDGSQGSQSFCREGFQIRSVLSQRRENFHTLDAVDAQISLQIQIHIDGALWVTGFFGDHLDQQRFEFGVCLRLRRQLARSDIGDGLGFMSLVRLRERESGIVAFTGFQEMIDQGIDGSQGSENLRSEGWQRRTLLTH